MVEWQRQQPQFILTAFSSVQRGSRNLMILMGLTSEGVDRLIGIVRGIFLPELVLQDREQAFALFDWKVGGEDALTNGTLSSGSIHSALLLLYVIVLCGCRVWEKGPWMIYEMSWACNIAMCLASAGMANVGIGIGLKIQSGRMWPFDYSSLCAYNSRRL